ncbi:MAG TPA: two pore domain potassium channel family protein [Candidatus Tidjanibacter faecipullorum]|uniref:Two pore domain potassium channel family protein n=1 Tax=Candidatus Tidjanibacter faecipullorum TaxID=2838766 RepID=A0A9D2DCS6_9BACT|nr:two pore domain potassium channel family protein [Candidatus Tidjanibacter faecipullorum]
MQVLRRIFNVLSLVSGILLLVAMSWEILTGVSTHFSPTYLWIQLFVCLVFMADFFIRMAVDEHKGRFFLRNCWFLLISIPYMNIIAWTGIDVSRQWSVLIIAVPLLRVVLALYIVIRWWLNKQIAQLLWAYIFAVLSFSYVSALIFFDFERHVNPGLHDFGDALFWVALNVTAIGADLVPVTLVGKILNVLLPVFGMLLFPIITAYVVQKFPGGKIAA